MTYVSTSLNSTQETALNFGIEFGSVITTISTSAAEALERDRLCSMAEKPHGIVFQFSLTQELSDLRSAFVEACAYNKEVDQQTNLFLSSETQKGTRLNHWSPQWRHFVWHDTQKKEKEKKKKTNDSNALDFPTQDYEIKIKKEKNSLDVGGFLEPERVFELSFKNLLVFKDGYKHRRINNILGNEDYDVELLSELFFEYPQVKQEVINYLLTATTASTIFNSFVVPGNNTVGRTVVNVDLYSREKVIKAVENTYSSVAASNGKSALIAIITGIFLAEISPLGIISRGTQRVVHEMNLFRSNTLSSFSSMGFNSYLECLRLAELVVNYIKRCNGNKYEDFLSKGRRTDRLADVFNFMYETIRHGLAFEVRSIAKLNFAYSVVESLMLIKLLDLPSPVRDVAPEILDDTRLTSLCEIGNLVIPLLGDATKKALALTIRPDEHVINQALNAVQQSLISNSYFEMISLSEFEDRYDFHEYLSPQTNRKIGLAILRKERSGTENNQVLAIVQSQVHQNYHYLDANSYGRYSKLLDDSFSAVRNSSNIGMIDEFIAENFKQVIIRGLMTDITDNELFWLAVAGNNGKVKGFKDGDTLTPQLVEFGKDLAPVIKGQVIDVKLFFEYFNDNNLLDEPFYSPILEMTRTTDCKEFLLNTRKSQMGKSAWDNRSFKLEPRSTSLLHFIPNEWRGLYLTLPIKYDVEENGNTHSLSKSLMELMNDFSRFGAYHLFDQVLFMTLSRRFEKFVFSEILRRDYLRQLIVAQGVNTLSERKAIMDRQKEQFANRSFQLIGKFIKSSVLCNYLNAEVSRLLMQNLQISIADGDVNALPELVQLRLNKFKINLLSKLAVQFNLFDVGALSFLTTAALNSELITEEVVDA